MWRGSCRQVFYRDLMKYGTGFSFSFTSFFFSYSFVLLTTCKLRNVSEMGLNEVII